MDEISMNGDFKVCLQTLSVWGSSLKKKYPRHLYNICTPPPTNTLHSSFSFYERDQTTPFTLYNKIM